MHLQRLLLSIPEECVELLSELRGYVMPDVAIRQDAVMSLAISIEHADLPFTGQPGRVLGVYTTNDTGAVVPFKPPQNDGGTVSGASGYSVEV